MARCPLQSSQSVYGTPARICAPAPKPDYLRVFDIPPRIPRSGVGLGAAGTLSEVIIVHVQHRGIWDYEIQPQPLQLFSDLD